MANDKQEVSVGYPNPSDLDIDTLVGRIFTITLGWREDGKAWDAEHVKAIILSWHQHQNWLAGVSHD